MLENQFILSNPANLKRLEESRRQAELGRISQHDLLSFDEDIKFEKDK